MGVDVNVDVDVDVDVDVLTHLVFSTRNFLFSASVTDSASDSNSEEDIRLFISSSKLPPPLPALRTFTSLNTQPSFSSRLTLSVAVVARWAA